MIKLVLSYVVFVVIGLAIGFAFGFREGLISGLSHLQVEVAEDLAGNVEVASSIRVSDHERALMLLDKRIDGAVLGLVAAERNLGYLTAQSTRRPAEALAWAQAYRRAVPATGPDAGAVRSALDAAGVQRASTLTPSLAKLASSGGR